MEIKEIPIYEGKSKALYEICSSKDNLLMRFKDEITAFNGKKKDVIVGRGIYNNQICSRIFEYLETFGINSHYLMRASDRDMLVQKTDIIPIEVVIRNNIAGGLIRRFGIDNRKTEIIKNPHTNYSTSILELFFKSDELDDPLMNEDHAIILGYVEKSCLDSMKHIACKVNYYLKEYFSKIGLTLADFKMEFGINKNKNVVLADDICPDGCRLWDVYGESFDKDIFRFDTGDIIYAYKEVYDRIIAVHENGESIETYLNKKVKDELKNIHTSFANGELDDNVWTVTVIEHMDEVKEPIVVETSGALRLKDVKRFIIKDSLYIATFERIEE